MSSSSLYAFLEKLDKELSEGATKNKAASEAYRTQKGNKKTSTLTYRPREITEAITNLTEIPKKLRKKYDDLVAGLTADIRILFKKKAVEVNTKNPGDAKVRGNKHSVSIRIIKRGQRDNYTLLKKTYEDRLDEFYTAFLTLINAPGGLKRYSDSAGGEVTLTRGKVWGQTHEGSANIFHMMNDAVYAAIQHTVQGAQDPSGTEIAKDLANLKRADAQIILDIMKDGPKEEVNMGISSALINSQQGGGIKEQGAKANLDAAIKSLKPFILATEGSDSLLTGRRKKIIKEIVKPFKNKKGIKVKHENIKINQNKSKVNLVKKPGKTIVEKGAALSVMGKKAVKRQEKRKATTSGMSLANILGVLNNQLPKTVANNMGSPRLENQTGRFAQSVRAIDVTNTAQGFPSIGYTYMRDRYGPYESTSGSRFADVDRDPRPLIDQSIREIVIGFGLGRLYTRRL